MQMQSAAGPLGVADIRFMPGLNEDLAVTHLWGAQQAELRGEGRFDGVFGLWYGKGPGVDRSGDAMRHANLAGTSPHGGVLMALGDDHTGESSTTCHQSDFACVDAQIPVLSPAGVQEILDFGLYGLAMSRFAGVWAGLKLIKDTVEVTSVVDGRPDRMAFVIPGMALPEGGLNIRLGDDRGAEERRLVGPKREAVLAFARANRIDKRLWGQAGARIGFVAAGKSWLDLVHALQLLGLDEAGAARAGVTAYKVGQTWPLETAGLLDWAEGLDLIVVVEEKRKLIEPQIKEALFDARRRTRVMGGRRGAEMLFEEAGQLDPVAVAEKLGQILIDEGHGSDSLRAALARVTEARRADNAPELAKRLPYFCAGCPHNTSTKVPEGARAGAGIGCHTLVIWMDRDTVGWTHMGAEGANWVGEAPFSTREHVFQNIGDGTYNHSGMMAIRSAVISGTTITYKILFNDAVALTGGQGNDGGLRPSRFAGSCSPWVCRPWRWCMTRRRGWIWACFPKGSPFIPATRCPPFRKVCARSRAYRPLFMCRPVPPKSVDAARREPCPTRTGASSSTPMSARAVAIAGCSPIAWRSSPSRRNWAASVPSTSRVATRISAVSRASAPLF
jgi:indolepyruvate ferredoxin oxidoreductase